MMNSIDTDDGPKDVLHGLRPKKTDNSPYKNAGRENVRNERNKDVKPKPTGDTVTNKEISQGLLQNKPSPGKHVSPNSLQPEKILSNRSSEKHSSHRRLTVKETQKTSLLNADALRRV